MNLSDLYDGDQRRRDPDVARMAANMTIAHPLHGIQYADGTDYCTHAKTCTTVLGDLAQRPPTT